MGDLWDIARKQMEDSFSSRKFLIVLGFFLIVCLASVYLGVQSYQDQLDRFSSGADNIYGAQPEEPSLIEIFEPLLNFSMPLAVGILGLLLSYNFISKEREEGTIELLLSYPIYRDEIINGKMIAGVFTVAFTLLAAFAVSSGLVMYILGQAPSMAQISRLAFIWLGTTIYIVFFLGLGTLLSTLFKSRWRALITGIAVLLFFVSISFTSSIAASFIYPYDSGGNNAIGGASSSMDVERPGMETGQSAADRREEIDMQREQFVSTVSKISPSNSYSEYTEIMLGTRYETEEGLEPTFGESLRDSLDPLIYLISQASLIMAAAYTLFLRQDL